MHVVLNGERREIADGTTLADLLDTLDLQNRRFAVEVNEELVPRSAHTTHPLRADDRIEVVHAIGGG
ncbi:MAG: sulfur carrier protein ThiS [Chromatiaceae bacterium]|nr:sulfur carrier protein ThiS [Gammaproteobacteria bacterium]MCP5305253.1 sulfur carrier protein ThiS [Chromatiaceae bacterium]MCP5315212.1 sulfur carrier protein ThiS [Chromatiaceae bacterium]